MLWTEARGMKVTWRKTENMCVNERQLYKVMESAEAK